MKLEQVALQLFTMREHCKTPADIANTLKRVREIGYQAVQASGMGPIEESELLKILDGEGLTLCATHEPGPMIVDEPEKVIERLDKLNCKHTAYPYPHLQDTWTNQGAVIDFAKKLDEVGAKFREAGKVLSYHNHQIEFRKIEGKTILDLFIENTSPENLKWELDTYWVQYGGGSNVSLLERLAGAIPLLHLKDFKINEEKGIEFAEVGEGVLEFEKIIATAERGGCEWFIVEQDRTPGDAFDSVKMSFDYIKENLAS